MILFPNAKINLGLHVLSKREDNFHNLETLMQPVGLCDILEFMPSPEKKTVLRLSGIPVLGEMEDNLVYKAYLLLKEKYQLPPLKIHLHKVIPSGAGLGGGSSDAAFMLKGLNLMFDLKIDSDGLKAYATVLGSDCGFFIENIPSLATGRGEVLKPAKDFIQNFKILLFFPEFAVSTAEAYRGIVPDPDKSSLESILESDISEWRKNLKNDFEETVFEKHPALGEMKEKIYESGAIYASMSGSGSAMYGLYKKTSAIPVDLQKFLIWGS